MTYPSHNYCRFYLVRHGETEWNVQQKMQGHKDSPLTPHGINQAKALGDKLKNVAFTHVFSSDLFRAQRTAEIIAADRHLAVKTSALLRETSFGEFEGKTVKFFREQLRNSLAYRESLTDKEQMKYCLYPGLETYEETASRCLVFMRETALAHLNHKVLAVSHAGTMRAVLVKLGYATNAQLPHGAIGNTSYAVIDADGINFFIRQVHNINLVAV